MHSDAPTIDLWVSGSDQSCCGVPFAVGDERGFALRAVTLGDGSGEGGGEPVRYVDDRHAADDRDRPVAVRGSVEAIVAVFERIVPVAGAHHLTSDPGDTIEQAVRAVPGSDDGPSDESPAGYSRAGYRVRLRVPADATLPRPVRRPGVSAADAGGAPVPPIAPLLSAVVADIADRFGDRVGILRARDDASVTLQPRATEAVAVRWNAYGHLLTVELDRAAWTLAPDEEGVATLRALVGAAADGGFRETVGGDGRLLAEARTPGGDVLTVHTPVPAGALGVTGAVLRRLERARSPRPPQPW